MRDHRVFLHQEHRRSSTNALFQMATGCCFQKKRGCREGLLSLASLLFLVLLFALFFPLLYFFHKTSFSILKSLFFVHFILLAHCLYFFVHDNCSQASSISCPFSSIK